MVASNLAPDPSARLEAAVRELAAAILAELAPAPVDAPDRLLSVEETADQLNLSRTKVYELVTSGALVTLKVEGAAWSTSGSSPRSSPPVRPP